MDKSELSKNKTGLIIEDEVPLLKAIQLKFAKTTFEVVTAQHVPAALQALSEVSPIDFVWLDHYLMGVETGIDLVMQMRRETNFRQVPVFLVSNTVSPDKVGLYKDLGIKKYFVKSDHKLGEIIGEIESEVGREA